MTQPKPTTPPKPILKIVPVAIEKDYVAPEGWTMRELLSVAVGNEAQFFAVLVKLPPAPEQKPSKPAIVT